MFGSKDSPCPGGSPGSGTELGEPPVHHKPELSRTKAVLVKHHTYVKKNRSMRHRAKICQRLFQLLDVMLSHHVELATALFDAVPLQQ